MNQSIENTLSNINSNFKNQKEMDNKVTSFIRSFLYVVVYFKS